MTATAVERGIRLGRADLLLVGAVVLWTTWLIVATVLSGQSLTWTSPYLAPPIWLLAAVALGRVLGHWGQHWLMAALAAVAGVVVLLVPLYANAQAAVGVQLVAFASLILLAEAPQPRPGRGFALGPTLASLVMVLGLLLALRSQAALVLFVVVGVVALLAVRFRFAPRLGATIGVAGVVLAWAVVAVLWLGRMKEWPAWLTNAGGLSQARHTLWQDALTLWRDHPVTGGGPGSFTASSELASSNPDLAAVHSSVLQVGAELGLVGVLLFALIVIGGLAVAAAGSRRAALITVTAWAALGVHSVIDHLFEFPVVMVAAGLVLGWAGSTRREQDPVPISDDGVVDSSA